MIENHSEKGDINNHEQVFRVIALFLNAVCCTGMRAGESPKLERNRVLKPFIQLHCHVLGFSSFQQRKN